MAGQAGTDRGRALEALQVCVCACVRACVRVCVCEYVRACVRAYTRARVRLPRLGV